jgi:hypothetical protein
MKKYFFSSNHDFGIKDRGEGILASYDAELISHGKFNIQHHISALEICTTGIGQKIHSWVFGKIFTKLGTLFPFL